MNILPQTMIISDPHIHDGSPIIAGTTIRVIEVVRQRQRPPDEIANHLGLTLSQVYSALAYYHAQPLDFIESPTNESRYTIQDTLYGVVLGVGDMPARADIRFLSGERLQCDIHQDHLDTIRELGKRLYETVGMVGIAQRDYQTGQLQHFTIEALTAYQETSVTEAFTRLATIVKPILEEMGGEQAYLDNARHFNEGDV